MKRSWRALAVAVGAFGLSCSTMAPGRPSPRPHYFVVVGFGNERCAKWTAARDDSSAAAVAYESWVDGYVSAYNQWAEVGKDAGNVTAGADYEVVISGAIDRDCRRNPSKALGAATQDAIAAILKRRIDREVQGIVDSVGAPPKR